MRNEKNIEIFRQWLKYHCAKDFVSMAPLFTESCLVKNVSELGTRTFPAKSREEAIRKFQSIHSTFPDYKMEEVTITSEDDVLFAVLKHSGTMLGKMQNHEPTGKNYVAYGAFKLEFENGQIKAITSFWNKDDMLTQLGLK